jgi:S-DNA-T family DNA segregation ATPase FtsK/SpoIIIE
MANSTRPRGPVLETQLRSQIRKRLMELLGLFFIFCAFITSAALYSYTPNDPNFLNSTSGNVQNLMGFLWCFICNDFNVCYWVGILGL